MKWMTICMALLATTALAGETAVLCDENDEDCTRIKAIRMGGDPVQVLFLGDKDEEPSFVPLRAFAARRGYLGASLTDLTPELRSHFGVPDDTGVMVSRVEKDSPADLGGVQVGDIITRAGGKPLAFAAGMTFIIRRHEEGDVIDLEVWRDGRPSTVSVTLTERERAHYDLSGLTASEALLAVAEDKALSGLKALERLEGLRILGGRDGRYIFRFDPDVARQYADAWEKYIEKMPGDRNAFFLREDDLENRIRELEEKLQELAEEIRSGSSDR